MHQHFRSFVILGGMRTGSNYLETTLNTVPGLSVLGELFNPEFIGQAGLSEFGNVDLAARDAEPLTFLAQVRQTFPELVGFRLFDGHDSRVLENVLNDRTCAKIVLTRNPADSFVSLEIARKTGQWKLGHARALRATTVEFDPEAFESYLLDITLFHSVISRQLQITGQTAFPIDYEDLGDVDVLNGLIAWLGLPDRLDQISKTLKPQNPGTLREKLTNPEVLDQVAARFDVMNMARTAFFEPQPVSAGQRFVVSRRLGLAYLPLAGAPREPVFKWMGSLIRGGIQTGLTLDSFQLWKAEHPNARTFVVVRHPLLKAWNAYGQFLSQPGMARHRGMLERILKCSLPTDGADLLAQRAGFLAFLRFVKMSLAGQTGQRPPLEWTAQADQIESLSRIQPPDLVLREEAVEAGLAFLAREVGARRRGVYVADPMDKERLAQILSEDIAVAVRQAWPRDYQVFGFKDWQPPQAA